MGLFTKKKKVLSLEEEKERQLHEVANKRNQLQWILVVAAVILATIFIIEAFLEHHH
jgi:uncharacterized integral membrane protein